MRKDFKAHDFKKGEMVRFANSRHFDIGPNTQTLGIVLRQNGMKIQVSWITWPAKYLKPDPWVNAYNLARIEKDAD
jgi:hypothetical protein